MQSPNHVPHLSATQMWHGSSILPSQDSHKHSYFHRLQQHQEWKGGLKSSLFSTCHASHPICWEQREEDNWICGVALVTPQELCHVWIWCPPPLDTNTETGKTLECLGKKKSVWANNSLQALLSWQHMKLIELMEAGLLLISAVILLLFCVAT